MAADLRIFSLLIDLNDAQLTLSDASKVIAMIEVSDVGFDVPENGVAALGRQAIALSKQGLDSATIAMELVNAVKAADDRGWVIAAVPSPAERAGKRTDEKAKMVETLVNGLESITGMSVKLVPKEIADGS